MRLSKIDLSKLVAISHDNDHLGLLIDLGNDLEYIEIPAPLAAYEGLQQLDCAIALASLSVDDAELPESKSAIAMLPVNSSMANAVGYDPDRNLLRVEFKGGSVYLYEDVHEETWEGLQAASSPGKFYNSEIKGSYRSHRVDRSASE